MVEKLVNRHIDFIDIGGDVWSKRRSHSAPNMLSGAPILVQYPCFTHAYQGEAKGKLASAYILLFRLPLY
jgi:hypothetical protein